MFAANAVKASAVMRIADAGLFASNVSNLLMPLLHAKTDGPMQGIFNNSKTEDEKDGHARR